MMRCPVTGAVCHCSGRCDAQDPRSFDEIEEQSERSYCAQTRWLPWWRRLVEWILGARRY